MAPSQQVAFDGARAEENDETIPSHQYRGVAGFRLPEAGVCPSGYSAVNELCAHRRLLAAKTPKELAREMTAFMAGAVPPIVADAPPAATRQPGEMEPDALQATEEQLRQREEGRSVRRVEAGPQVVAAAKETTETDLAVPAANAGSPQPAAPAQMKQTGGAVTLLVPQGPSGIERGANPDMLRANQMLQELQGITGDGEVDIAEAGRLFQILGSQLGSTELATELRIPRANDR